MRFFIVLFRGDFWVARIGLPSAVASMVRALPLEAGFAVVLGR